MNSIVMKWMERNGFTEADLDRDNKSRPIVQMRTKGKWSVVGYELVGLADSKTTARLRTVTRRFGVTFVELRNPRTKRIFQVTLMSVRRLPEADAS